MHGTASPLDSMDGFDTPQSGVDVDSDDFEGASGDGTPVPTLEVGDLVTCGTVYDTDKLVQSKA